MERCSCRVIWGTSPVEKEGRAGTSLLLEGEGGKLRGPRASWSEGQGEGLRQAGRDSLGTREQQSQGLGSRRAKLLLQLPASAQGRDGGTSTTSCFNCFLFHFEGPRESVIPFGLTVSFGASSQRCHPQKERNLRSCLYQHTSTLLTFIKSWSYLIPRRLGAVTSCTTVENTEARRRDVRYIYFFSDSFPL